MPHKCVESGQTQGGDVKYVGYITFACYQKHAETNRSGKITSSAASRLLRIEQEVIITVNDNLQLQKNRQESATIRCIANDPHPARTYGMPHRSHTVTNKTADFIGLSLTFAYEITFSHIKT